jgi:hypothetical protein
MDDKIFNEIKEKIKKENNIELEYEKHINEGSFNIVLKVHDIKKNDYALRIAKPVYYPEIQKDTYERIKKSYDILKDIFPKTIKINNTIPYYILY